MPFPILAIKAPQPVRRLVPNLTSAAPGLASAAPGDVFDCPYDVRAVMLDPEFTSPGAIVAVSASGSAGDEQYLRPGDIALFPRALRRFFARNVLGGFASQWSAAPSEFSNATLVRAGFLVAQTPEQLVERRDAVKVRPRAAVLWQGPLTAAEMGSANAPEVTVVAAGLRALRVSVLPMQANGADLVSPVPADFAATLRPWTLAAGGTKTVGGQLRFYMLAPYEPLSAGFAYVGGAKPAAKWLPNEEGDLLATPTQLTFDREAPAGALGFGFSVPSLAGAGVVRLWLIVEGY